MQRRRKERAARRRKRKERARQRRAAADAHGAAVATFELPTPAATPLVSAAPETSGTALVALRPAIAV